MAADQHAVVPDGPARSPQGLNIKPRPGGIVRVNLWVVVVVTLAVVVVALAITSGVLMRRGSAATTPPADMVTRLEPALQAGEVIARDIPDGSLPARSAGGDKKQALNDPQVLDTKSDAPTPASPGPAADSRANGIRGASLDPVAERERRLIEAHETKLTQALEAGTAATGAMAGSAPVPQAAAPVPANPLQTLQTLAGQLTPGPTGATPAGLREEDDQNRQLRKEQFVRDLESRSDHNAVNATRKAGLSPFEVKAGWLIPATLEQGINSDLPGKISARVTQNVMDTATGRHLLIPQGALLLGTYDSQVAFGQDGLLVVWRRIIFPDASSVDLEGMGGVDQSGYAGFRDSVNNHYGRIFGFGLITSLFGAAYQVSQNTRESTLGAAATPSQTAGAGVAQQLSQLGIEIARKNLRVQPTIEIRPGYQFNVRVDKDLVFSRAYASGNAR